MLNYQLMSRVMGLILEISMHIVLHQIINVSMTIVRNIPLSLERFCCPPTDLWSLEVRRTLLLAGGRDPLLALGSSSVWIGAARRRPRVKIMSILSCSRFSDAPSANGGCVEVSPTVFLNPVHPQAISSPLVGAAAGPSSLRRTYGPWRSGGPCPPPVGGIPSLL